MALIRIREYAPTAEGFEAAVSFDDGTEYPITIRDPFSQKDEKRLEWCFEKWLSFPFIHQVEAQQAAASILAYGESLISRPCSSTLTSTIPTSRPAPTTT
jgi:hypothetical protein